MRKSLMMLAVLAILVVAVVASTGCVTESDYSPMVPVTVYSKYTTTNSVAVVHMMVCTSLGTYMVYGPDGVTSYLEDTDAYTAMPINQTINVRLAGNKLWWDYKSTCWQNSNGCVSCYNNPSVGSCCCNRATPTPTPVPVPPSCSCGCKTCGCGC